MKLINRSDIKQRILWFSDIHILEDEIKKGDFLDRFLHKFVETCNKINHEQIINYVIISGDLANKGTKIEFDNFTKHILRPLFQVLKNSKLLVVPGNHDVTIENIFDYKDIVSINKRENRDKRNDFFLENQKYKSFFVNYSAFCKDNLDFFPKNITEPYKTDFLYGYYKDEENKLLFVLLNSAWLSLSVKLLEHILYQEYIHPISEEYKKIYIQFKRIKYNNIRQIKKNVALLDSLIQKAKEEITEKAYNISYQTVEYGTQELFLNFLSDSIGKLQYFLEKHKSYFIITIMHHPENHLKWGERVDPNSLFSYLKKKSDIVLSSHEHVPKEYIQSHDINDTLHLKSGPFIELEFRGDKKDPKKPNQFDYYNENYLEKSTFSILDINITKKKVHENKYSYDINNKKWIKLDDLYSKFPLKNDIIKLDYSDIELVYSKIISISNIALMKKIINLKIKQIANKSNMFSLKNNLYVIHNNLEFIDKIDIDGLKNVILKNKVNKIFFYSFDILVDHPVNSNFDKNKLNEFYQEKKREEEDQNQNFVLGELKTKMNKNFNGYRSKFFNSLTCSELEIFSDISFIFVLLPYWEIERAL